ncbi:MAG: molybdenum cofactor biosynthesis protein MoaE [Alphaproteobacteria bacterium]
MIRVQREDFDPGAELERLIAGKNHIGGAVSFVGLVRDMAQSRAIGAMTLEHYPGMTEKLLGEIEAEARRRWSLDASLIVHRYGRLLPGERIVLVIAASAHRAAAFEAAAFLVDWLKTAAPFWKYEETPSGGHWVEARTADDEAARRWQDGGGTDGEKRGDFRPLR